MTQSLIDLFNSRLDAYNRLLDERIGAAQDASQRRQIAAMKFSPITVGDISDDELRRRLRRQRLGLGSILKNRAVQLLRHIEPDVLHLDRYTVGLSYARIIEVLRQEFPETQVSSACLRWYVSRINEESRDLGWGGNGLPQYRPRSKDTAYLKGIESRRANAMRFQMDRSCVKPKD